MTDLPTAKPTDPEVVPEQGQLVRARDRLWVVSEVSPSNLDPDVLATNGTRKDHVVHLSSIEDDGFGDEISLLWEVEPGTEVIDKPRLPDPSAGEFDTPKRLDAFLNAVRWGAITSAEADALQSPFRSGIEIEDYQLAPLVRALQMPRANLLIADDVGLGKTIEAGLVVQELLLRHRARTVMILCPPSLCHKWQVEMADRFGLEFRILDSDTVRQLRRDRGFGVNPFTHFPRLIVSLDWIKLDPQMALLAEILPPDSNTYPRKFDLLIVDEVHTCAPPAGGRYATDSLRTKSIRRLAPHFEHRLFLSATPHNGYAESFQGLLELLDRQRFAKGVDPSPATLGQAMVRRLKTELAKEAGPRPDGSPRFPERQIKAIPVDYPETEARVYADLERYRNAQERIARNDRAAATATKFVTLLLKKRLLSSPAAFAATLEQHISTLNQKLESGRFGKGERRIKEIFARLDDDIAIEDDLDDATAEALSVAAANSSEISHEAEECLARMRAWATANRGRASAKAIALLDWIEETCRPNRTWNNERVIVFTEYRATQEYLRILLAARGLGGERLALIYGGMDPLDRRRVNDEFQYDPEVTKVRILLATDAASEGIDLQRFCHRVVHVEIPFSPTRLEQRNGRIDRHGQPSPVVEIFHFVGRDPDSNTAAADADFLYRVAVKVNEIRSGLGSANPVIEEQIEEAMLGRRRTLDEKRIDDSASKAASRLKRIELNLREEVRRFHERLTASIEELGISPAAVEEVVMVGLELGRQLPLEEANHPSGARVFRVPDLTGSWASAVVGLHDTVKDERRPVTFDAEIARGRMNLVHLHLGHPLVSRSLRLLRAQVWSTGAGTRINRVAARVATIDDLTVVAHARVVITGTDGKRLHEEVVDAGGRWVSGRLEDLRVAGTKTALAAATGQPVPPGVESMLADQWGRMRGRVESILSARAEEVGRQREARLDKRRDAEIDSIRSVLTDLKASIEKELGDLARKPEVFQLRFEGFDTDERLQFERDLDALRRRVEEIPDEIEREVARLSDRYRTRDIRVFPVAVTFLVPPALAGVR